MKIKYLILLALLLTGCQLEITTDENGNTVINPVNEIELELTVSDTSVVVGESVVITWRASDADYCKASGKWLGDKSLVGEETVVPVQQISTYSLECFSDDKRIKKSVSVVVSPLQVDNDQVGLNFQASEITIVQGQSITLSWNSENSDSCIARGDWSGPKVLSGNEIISSIRSDSQFILICNNTHDEVQQIVSVTVSLLPGQPLLSLSSNLSMVDKGGYVTLSWLGENVFNCKATGSWNGDKELSGSELVGPISDDANLTLTCDHSNGDISKFVAVTVTPEPDPTPGAGVALSGIVDSSFISRLGMNKVYLYKGRVVPDDIDGDSGDPFLTFNVEQQAGSCNYQYEISELPLGDYTLAITSEAENDNSQSDDSIAFSKVIQFVHNAAAQTKNISASVIHQVGPTRNLKTVLAAANIASSGDVIEIDAGVYADDIVVWRTNDLTIRGVNGRAHIMATRIIPYNRTDLGNGMGIWVVKSNDVTIENIEFSGASVDGDNGAGIRNQGDNLTVCGSYFHDNENGILGSAFGSFVIENSEFYKNGFGDGYSHNIYIDEGDKFVIRYSKSDHAIVGHNIKTRAKENHILYNQIIGENDANTSYDIDVPNGGLTYIIGNIIQQSVNTGNNTMVSYGAEGLLSDGRIHKTFIINNTFVNDLDRGRVFSINGGVSESNIINNLYVSEGTINGIGNLQNNLKTSSPDFKDELSYDYHLTANSPAVNAGGAPGSGIGVDLNPMYEFVSPVGVKKRVQSGSDIDIGAFEFEF